MLRSLSLTIYRQTIGPSLHFSSQPSQSHSQAFHPSQAKARTQSKPSQPKYPKISSTGGQLTVSRSHPPGRAIHPAHPQSTAHPYPFPSLIHLPSLPLHKPVAIHREHGGGREPGRRGDRGARATPAATFEPQPTTEEQGRHRRLLSNRKQPPRATLSPAGGSPPPPCRHPLWTTPATTASTTHKPTPTPKPSEKEPTQAGVSDFDSVNADLFYNPEVFEWLQFFMWMDKYQQYLVDMGILHEDSTCPEDIIPHLLEVTSDLKEGYDSMKVELDALKASVGWFKQDMVALKAFACNGDAKLSKLTKIVEMQMVVNVVLGLFLLLAVFIVFAK